MTLETPREAVTVDAGHPQPAVPIRRGTAQRLGLRPPPTRRRMGRIPFPPPPWAMTVADVITATQLGGHRGPDLGWRP